MRIRITTRALVMGALVTGALSLAVLSGCSKSQPTGSAPAASASAAVTDPVEAFLADEKAPLTAPVYSKLVTGLDACKVTDRGIDPTCEAYKKLRRAQHRRSSAKDMAALNAKVGKELIGHKSPAVRLQAAKMMQSVFGSNEDVQKVIVDAAKKEKTPAVLAAMLRTVGSRHKQSEDIKQLLLQMADHENDTVRREALSWFLTTFGEGVPGTFDKVLEKMEKDPSLEVKTYLCGRLYGSSDERAIPVFERLLSAADTDPKLYGACWNGVINSWTGFPKPRNPSKAGYELTLKVLEKKPRTKERPPWSGISTLRSAKTEYSSGDRFGTEWLDKVKPWFKPSRLLTALKDVANDSNANWMARTAALRVMQELGEGKATFTALAKKYEKATQGDEFHVKRQIDDILRKIDAGSATAAASGSGAPPSLPILRPMPPGGEPEPTPPGAE
jgi:hypothetical protein